MNDPETGEALPAGPFAPKKAAILREIMTALGISDGCRRKPCRRIGACATRHVLCYQARFDDLKPIVRSIGARVWAAAVARGRTPEVAPAAEGDMRRLLAFEDEEIAAIRAGTYGDDDALTDYQIWLKYGADRLPADGRTPAGAVSAPASRKRRPGPADRTSPAPRRHGQARARGAKLAP